MLPKLEDTITATEPNRYFSEVPRKVRDGQSINVTIDGDPVVDRVPHRRSRTREEREREHREFLAYLRSLPALNAGTWTRDRDCRTPPHLDPGRDRPGRCSRCGILSPPVKGHASRLHLVRRNHRESLPAPASLHAGTGASVLTPTTYNPSERTSIQHGGR